VNIRTLFGSIGEQETLFSVNMLSAELCMHVRKIETTFNPILEITIVFSSVKIALPKSYLREVPYGIRRLCLLYFISLLFL
jgi:hypothetical protein